MSAAEEETDKKQIEAEEQQVMLPPEEAAGAENGSAKDGPVKTALAGPVSDEGREVKPKFIPIGGIKMPGFFTRNSDKNKEEEVATDTEKPDDDKTKHKRRRMLFSCPFTQFLHHRRNQPANNVDGVEPMEEQPSRVRRLREALRAPADRVASLLRRADKDPEAALASMETLGDKLDKDDGMENIKLDATPDEPEEGQLATKLPFVERVRQRKFIKEDLMVPAAAIVILIMVVLISMLAGAGPPAERPLRDGIYVTTLTSCGPVEGVLKDGAYNFYGIPYAMPPVGEKRFTYAQPLNNISACWNKTLNVQNPAPLCLQTLENRTIIGQEDCLTVDIITPHVRYDSPLPVIVMIGANSLEGGVGPLQPSARYARTREVVFVRPNFRLGPLGFLALDILSKTKYPPTSGNYGLSDLIVALNWIQLNIKHFGGDPNSVTILGHRAGATLGAIITTMSQAKSLYARSWLTSPSIIFPGEPLQESEAKNVVFLQQTACDTVECLRNMDATKLLQAVPDTWTAGSRHGLPEAGESAHSWLVMDGDLIRQHPYDAWEEAKKYASQYRKEQKKIVFGSTEHASHTDLLYRRHINWTAEQVELMLNQSTIIANITIAQISEHINKTYEGLVELISAIRYVCPLVSVARFRLDAPMYKVTSAGAGARSPAIASINADIEDILGTLKSDKSEERQSVMQHYFYYFATYGRLPSPAPSFVAIGQDLLPLQALPLCDLLISKDIVPRYAHVD